MAFTKKTYIEGQTPITADNLNAIQDELIDIKNGKYYSISDRLPADNSGKFYGSTLTIAEPGIYLVIAFNDLNYNTDSIVLAGLSAISGATALFSNDSRGTASSGGGVFSIGIYDCEANAQIKGRTYIYSPQSGKYSHLSVFAIRLN